MKVYKCDACGKTIENPYKASMKEFYVGIGMELDFPSSAFPIFCKRKKKIDLCDECFHNLRNLGKK